MKAGDLVRFRQEQWKRNKPADCGMWVTKIGLLVEYHPDKNSTKYAKEIFQFVNASPSNSK